MNELEFLSVKDKDINFYLNSRNKLINRINSKNKNSIRKIDHYIWWFTNKNRTSTLAKQDGKTKIILFEEKTKIKNQTFILTGMISCANKINFKTIFNSIKFQNKNLERLKNVINIVIVNKSNKFGNAQTRYFQLKKLEKNHVLYNNLKKFFSINENKTFIYYKNI